MTAALTALGIVLSAVFLFPSVMTSGLASGVNAYRASQGLPAMDRSSRLDRVAQARADDLVAQDYFSHTSPSGQTVFSLLDARYPGWWTEAGENIAWNNYPEDQAIDGAIQAWIGSPGHRDLMLGDWRYMGTGLARHDDGRWKFVLVVANVVAPKPKPTPIFTPPVKKAPTVKKPEEVVTLPGPQLILGPLCL